MVETNFKHTEIGLIPHDWEVKTLADVGTIRMCKRIMKYQTSDSGDIPFYKIGTFGKQADAYISKELYNEFRSKYNYPKKGDILLSAAGTIGRTVVFDGKPAYFQDSNIVWIENNEGLVVNSLLYYIYHRVNWVTDTGTIPRIYNGNVSAIRFPIPPTLAEQERIAGALSSIDTLIGALTEQIEKKRHIKQGTMQQLLTGKKRLTRFTEKWKEVVFGDVVGIYRGGSPRPIENYLTTDPSGINWIKIGDVGVDAKYIEHTAEKIIPEGISRSRKVYSGDFLLSNSMSFGRPYILKIDGCIHDGWLVIQNYQETFDREFLYYILSSNAVLLQYKALAAGSSVLNLNKDIVAKVQLTIPPTIAEQSAIAAVLSGMDTEIAALEQKRDKYIAIKSGMMQNLLTGKIRLV